MKSSHGIPGMHECGAACGSAAIIIFNLFALEGLKTLTETWSHMPDAHLHHRCRSQQDIRLLFCFSHSHSRFCIKCSSDNAELSWPVCTSVCAHKRISVHKWYLWVFVCVCVHINLCDYFVYLVLILIIILVTHSAHCMMCVYLCRFI